MTNEQAARFERQLAIEAAMKRYDIENTSTLICPCGAQFEWKGFSDGLSPWLDAHAACTSRENPMIGPPFKEKS